MQRYTFRIRKGLFLAPAFLSPVRDFLALAALVFSFQEPAFAQVTGSQNTNEGKSQQELARLRPGKDLSDDPLPEGAVTRFGSVRFRCVGLVSAIAYSPDGKRIACAGRGGVRCFEAANGKLLWSAPGEFDSISFIDRGLRVLAAGDNIVVCDASTGREMHQLASAGGLRRAVVSLDEKRLAGVGRDAILMVDAVTGGVLREFEGHQGNPAQIMGVALSPDGKLLATACFQDPRVLLWNIATGKIAHSLPDHLRPGAVSFSSDGRFVATGDQQGCIRVWDVASGRSLHELNAPAGAVHGLAFAPDGSILAAAVDRASRIDGGELPPRGQQALDHTVLLWHLPTSTHRALSGPMAKAESVVFSPDGKTLATGGSGGLYFIDLASSKVIQRPGGHVGWIRSLAVSPDGLTLASAGDDHLVHLWDARTGKPTGLLGGPQALLNGLVFTPDGKELLSCALDGRVRVWDWRLRKEIRSFGGSTGPLHGFALDPDGTTLFVSRGEFWNIKTGEILPAVPNYKGAQFAALAPDGKRIISRPSRTAYAVLDVSTGGEIARFTDPNMTPSAAFSPDGSRVASAAKGGVAIVWDATTGRLIRRMQGPEASYMHLVFSPDGRMLVTGEGDNRRKGSLFSVRLWELWTGKDRRKFSAHEETVTTLVFSPNRTILFTGSDDGLAYAWDVAGALKPEVVQGQDDEAIWRLLGSDDAVAAYEVICALSARKQVALLARHLKPVVAPDALKVARLIVDLDSNSFATRDRAQRELEELDELAAPTLRNVLKETKSDEVHRRVEALLDNLDAKSLPAKLVQELRGVEILERIGNADARTVLDRLASGASQARLTQEAKASLRRLGK